MSDPVFRWATVTGASPLRIKLDGDTASLPITPDSLVDPATLIAGDRVRVELTYQRVIIHGRSGGRLASLLGHHNKIRNGNFRTSQRGAYNGIVWGPGTFGFDGWETTSKLANLVQNGSNENATAGYLFSASSCTIDGNDTSWAAVGSRSVNLYSPSSSDSFVFVEQDAGGLRLGLQAGHTYTFSATGNVKVAITGEAGVEADGNGGTAARARALVVHVLNAAGTYVIYHSPQVPNVINTPTRVSVTVAIPAGATGAFVRLYLGGTGGQIRWDAVRVVESNTAPVGAVADNVYVDGATAGNAWAGAANASQTFWGSGINFTAAPQGQPLTLGQFHQLGQRIERCDLPAGVYTLSWAGTAKARMWKPGTAEASKPAWSTGPITVTTDGLTDWNVEFIGGASGGGTLSQVQFEPGAVATPYEVIPVDQELLICQRYFQQLTASASNQRFVYGVQPTTTQAEASLPLPVPLRTTPTVGFANLWWTDTVLFNAVITSIDPYFGYMGQNVIGLRMVWSGAQGAPRYPGALSAQNAGSYLFFDAELRLEAA